MASFVLSFFPLDVLDEIWDLIASVSEGFLTYSWKVSEKSGNLKINGYGRQSAENLFILFKGEKIYLLARLDEVQKSLCTTPPSPYASASTFTLKFF